MGGPYVNALTEAHLHQFCPAFQLFRPTGPEVFNATARRCGPHEFVETKDLAWGFVVKLAPRLTGRLHTTIPVWGLGAIGTSGAAYFLSDLHRKLPVRNESFFIAIPIQRAIGYRGVSTSAVDISNDVWAPGAGTAHSLPAPLLSP
jgi:hypothetical protein